MAKKITVVGTGYVGLIAAVGLADFGNTVIGVDVDEEKIKILNSGQSHIYEVKTMMRGNVVFDARNLLSRKSLVKEGFIYQGLGR